MSNINKLTIGIRTSSNMFRISSLAGQIIDNILIERGKKPLEKQHFSKILTNHEQGDFRLHDDKVINILTLSRSNIILTKDLYSSNKYVNIKKTIDEFLAIWKIINKTLKVTDVRRIGIIAEHQVECKEKKPSSTLLNNLTKIKTQYHPGRFNLRFEERYPTKDGAAPDIEKSDFINVIHSYYDGEIDNEHSNKGTMNLNIDLQRYFSPLIIDNIGQEVKKLSKELPKQLSRSISRLKDLGISV